MKKRTSKKNDDLRIYTLEEAKDKLIGKRGTAKREEYELDLSMDVLSDMIKRLRMERDMTQTELGKLIGVQKAQISRLENSPQNMTLGTALKLFTALHAEVKFIVRPERNALRKQVAARI